MDITSYGDGWLDDLPQRWETRLLKHKLSKITDGSHVSPDTSERAYPFVSTVDIENGSIDFENCLQTSAESYSMLSSQGCSPKTGDVLFSKDGTVGETALIDFGKNFVVASSLIILTPPQVGVFPAFLDLMLRSHFVLEQINSFVKGSALKRVSVLNIKKVIGIFPPVEEQTRIVAHLNNICADIDRSMEAKQKQIETLDALRKSIIHKAVTRGLDDSVELKDSGVEWLGRIPRHWRAVQLKQVSNLQSGITLGKRYGGELIERPYLRVANVQEGYLELGNVKTILLPESEAKRTELCKEDVLMTEGGDLDKLGRGHIWDGQVPHCLHQNHIFAIRCNIARLLPEFLTFITSSGYGRAYFEATGKRTTNLASTNATKIRSFRIPLPPMAEQTTIVESLMKNQKQSDRLQENLHSQISSLKQYRRSLIHECVTGKRRITEEDVQDPI